MSPATPQGTHAAATTLLVPAALAPILLLFCLLLIDVGKLLGFGVPKAAINSCEGQGRGWRRNTAHGLGADAALRDVAPQILQP